MSARQLFFSDSAYFSGKPLPPFLDRELMARYPSYGECVYDLRLSTSSAPTAKEKECFFCDPDRECFGKKDLTEFSRLAAELQPTRVCVTGLNQKQFSEAVSYIKDSVKQLYLFKCRSVKDLEPLADCKGLECLLMYGNYGVSTLWNLERTPALKVISLEYVTGIRTLASLEGKALAYFSWDSRDLCGNPKGALTEIPAEAALHASYVKVVCKNYKINYEK